MKKIFYMLAAAMVFGLTANAAPGDTTWVQGNIAQLSYFGNSDTLVHFPATGATYRRIYMVFTLGKYMCPAGSTYCGDWDYTVQNFLMTPGGDTLELGRLITPYANAGAPRTPWAWQQPYVYDVTDYASLLHDNATMRIFFSGYSGGFTANIRFAFIEGTPDRNVLGIHRLWAGSYAYGDTSGGGANNINVHFPARSETAPTGTATATVKFNVTGHGSDANNCCEFLSNNYQVMLNGASVSNTAIWRNDCGSNELYPQSGTWLLTRANWCPGALVNSHFHDLPGITGGTTYNVALQFDPYIGSGGSYTTDAAIIYYGKINKANDVSIEDIIAPTSNPNHFRENPTAQQPVIHIKNTGSNTVTSVVVKYYIDAADTDYYTWTGSLGALQETDIQLAVPWQLRLVSGTTGMHTFTAQVAQVNGNTGDDDATNNTLSSQFIAAPQWPVKFVINMKTNSVADSTGNSETRWQITDESGAVVASRNVAAVSTAYSDTLTLGPANYKLEITDGSCDGLHWWPYDGSSITAGSFNVKKITGSSTITMKGYNYSGEYNNDFGCSFTQYFTTSFPTNVTNVNESALSLDAYPNPAQNVVYIDVNGLQSVKGSIQIIDALGRTVATTACTASHQQVDIANLVSGVYTVIFTDGTTNNRLNTRLLIAK